MMDKFVCIFFIVILSCSSGENKVDDLGVLEKKETLVPKEDLETVLKIIDVAASA
jgi:hypothetical protein